MMILFPELTNDLPAEASYSMRCFLNLTNLPHTEIPSMFCMYCVEVLEDIERKRVFNIISIARKIYVFQCKQKPALW